MSAPLYPEIRALLARCMAQIELEWGQPDAELRAVLGVPLDAPLGTKPPEPGEPALLPCPLCGSDARSESGGGTSQWSVQCTACYLESWFFPSQDDAAAAWNKRHPADALRTGAMTLNEARAARGLPPVREFDAPCVADLVETFEEASVRDHQPGGRKSAIIRHPWQACAACGPWRHFDARAIAATPEDVATLFSPAESMDFEEAHIVVGDRCVPWVLTPGQVAQLLGAGGRPC